MVFTADHQLFQIYDERSSGEASSAPVSDEKFDSYQYQYDNRAGSYTLLQPKVYKSSSGSKSYIKKTKQVLSPPMSIFLLLILLIPVLSLAFT